MSNTVWVYTTWPNRDSAKAAARTALEEKLCACANVFGEIESLYVWDGVLTEDTECVMTLKTSREAAAALCDRIIALHPYSEPCVVALPIASDGSAPEYLRWVRNMTHSQP